MHLTLTHQFKQLLRRLLVLFRHRQLSGKCALVLLGSTLVSTAQTNHPATSAAVSANRFLFIVETSAAIKPQAPSLLKVVGDLINSGANGQMHDGDTIGLWTYNQQVYSSLPVQIWAQTLRSQIADRTAAFMRRQPLEKTAQFDKVLPEMFGIMGASEFITVLIVSSGDGKMKGTPFDAEINALYQQTIKDMKGQRMPIVTVLQAKSGKLLRYTINALPWPVIIPEVPFLLKPAPAVAIQPAPRQTPVNPPIITHPANPPSAGIATNPIPQTAIPAPAPKTIIPQPVVQPQSAPPIAATLPAAPPASTPPPSPAPAVTAPPRMEIPKNETPIVAPEPSPQPPVVAAKPIAPAAPPELSRTIAQFPAGAPPGTEPAALPKPTPTVVAAPAPSPPAPESPQISASNATLAAASEPVQRSRALLIASIGLVIAALVLIFMMLRRGRSPSGPSLITHAIGNKKK